MGRKARWISVEHPEIKVLKYNTGTGEVISDKPLQVKRLQTKVYYNMKIESQRSKELYRRLSPSLPCLMLDEIVLRIKPDEGNRIQVTATTKKELAEVINTSVQNSYAIFNRLKDTDLIRPIPDSPGQKNYWMINPEYVWKGDLSNYEIGLQEYYSLEFKGCIN